MDNLFLKALSFSDEDVEKAETRIVELLNKTGAMRKHLLDNVAVIHGKFLVLEDLHKGDDIVYNGELYGKTSAEFSFGDYFEN